MSDPFRRVVFVHVPKTAGTSLRTVLTERLGDDIVFDYGPKAAETSEIVRRHVAADDRPGLCAELARRERFVLFGHLRAADYRDLAGVADFVTFLRDPFERVVSEFNHFVQHYKYARSFRQFIDTPQFRNRQSLFAGGVPIERYGFVGLHETYAEDMAALIARLGLDVEIPRVNVGTYAKVDRTLLRERHGAYFRSVNAEDYTLLDRAKAMRRDEPVRRNA